MAKKKTHDTCRLCGNYREMTFEHIPPAKAFNDQPRLFQTLQNLMEERTHTKFRRGIGKQSLCSDCNNRTGGLYAEAFIDWTRQGLEWYDKLQDKNILYLPYNIKPLNVLKQSLVMTLALSSVATLNYHWELRKFLMDKNSTYLPDKYKVYIYFNTNGQPRYASGLAISNIRTGSMDYIDAEVSLPPFGYCVTSSTRKNQKSLAEEKELCDITWFSKYNYDQPSSVQLRIPARETHEPFPLDYRTKEEIKAEKKRNKVNY